MTERIREASPRTYARIAGLLYLIVIVAGIFVLWAFLACLALTRVYRANALARRVFPLADVA